MADLQGANVSIWYVNGDGGTAPNLSSVIKNRDTSVDWTYKTFNAGDILEFTIDSVATITNCQLILKIRRTS